jgi:hypothetical protein
MSVRCKFCLTQIISHAWGGAKTLIFTPQYDQTIEEDRRFAKSSPSGEFKIHVDNPAALAQFELGKHYYFDATPVPVAVAAAE